MYQIAIADSQRALEVNQARLREVCEHVLSDEQVASAEISIAIVGSTRMQALNKQHLNHDYDTDVLSFLLDCAPDVDVMEHPDDGPRGRGKSIDGEIIVCAEMAKQMAGQLEWDALAELDLYVVHGLLHLVGYDDLDPHEQSIMRQRERELMQHWGLSVRHLHPAPLEDAHEDPMS